MKPKDVLLVQPLGELSKPSGYMRTCYLEPIGLEYLAASAEAAGFSTKIVSGDLCEHHVTELVTEMRPGVVGFSVHSYVWSQSLRLATAAKSAARAQGYELVTVFGGPHPTACPESVASHDAVDFVVIGEGEVTFVELLEAVLDGHDASSVAGVAFRRGTDILLTTRRDRIRDLDGLPWPKRDPAVLSIAKQYQIAYPPPGQQVRIAQVMHSRGCVFSCSFCSSENTWGREVIWRSPEGVLDEIEWLVSEHKTNLVYFPDLTFNLDRQRVLDLCGAFCRRRLPIHWWALFRVDMLDEELLIALREAGCVKISLGLESPNLTLATHLKGSYDAHDSTILRNLVAANDLGFIIKAFLIIGFPDETPDAIRGYLDCLFEFPIDELRVTFATPFPGTRFFQQCLDDELIDAEPDWSKFTTEVPILRHPSMPDAQLVSLREKLVTGFYLDQRYALHIKSKLEKFPHLHNSWREYFEFLDSRGVFVRDKARLNVLMSYLENLAPDKRALAANSH